MESFNSVNICFFGVNRSLTATIKSIKQYLFDCLDEYSIAYSVYGSFMKIDNFSNLRSNEFDQKPEITESDLIKFDGLKYVDQGAIDDLIRWDLVFRYGDTYGQINSPNDLREKNSTTKNIFRSLFCLKSSYSLIPPEFLDRPTIFLRPDIEILSDIDIEFNLYLLSRKPKKYAFGQTDGVAIFPSWHSWDGLNDRFAMCSPGNAASAYANRFDGMLPYLDISKHPIHPESYLLQSLQSRRVETLPIISTLMARIRANGIPQDEDFSKGAKTLNLQSETMRALNDLIKERDASIIRLQDKLDEAAKSFASQRNQSKDSHDVELQALSDQIESLKAEADIYLREKDEARQVVKELRDNALELQRERDEARQVVKELRDNALELQREKDEARQVVKELRDNALELANKLENECQSNETLALQVKTLKLDLARIRGELSGLQEDAKSTLRSFHQVQQELEYYFQYSRKQSEMLEANANLQQRAAILLSKSSK